MNKNERLLDIIGKCDDRFIEQAGIEVTPIAKKRSNIWKIATAAACICVVGAGVFVYSQHSLEKNNAVYTPSVASGIDEQAGTNDIETSEDNFAVSVSEAESEQMSASSEESKNDIYQVPQWDEMEIYEQYSFLEFNDTTYIGADIQYQTIANVDNSLDIGEKLSDAEMWQIDQYTEVLHTINAEIYELVGISSDCAVAIKFEGDLLYYVYTNHGYVPLTLGDFVDDLNLEENLGFGNTLNIYTANGEVVYEYRNFTDTDVFWDMLLSFDDAKAVEDYIAFYDKDIREETNLLEPIAQISVSSEKLGFDNLSISVTQGGYITTNIFATGKAFYIGEDNTQAFVEYILNNYQPTVCGDTQNMFDGGSDDTTVSQAEPPSTESTSTNNENSAENTTTSNTTTTDSITQSDELEAYRLYPLVDYNNESYVAGAPNQSLQPLSVDDIAKKLGTTTAMSYDGETVNVEIFSLTDALKECAIAVRFEGEENYYVYKSPVYMPETFGDLVSDLNLTDHLEIGALCLPVNQNGIAYISDNISTFGNNNFWDILWNFEESLLVTEYDESALSDIVAEFIVSSNRLGIADCTISITKNGYLVTDILSTPKVFCIGEQEFEDFAEYTAENYDASLSFTLDKNGTIYSYVPAE